MKFTLCPLCVKLALLVIALSGCSDCVSAAVIPFSVYGSAGVTVDAQAAGLAPHVLLDDDDEFIFYAGQQNDIAIASKSAKTVGTMKYEPWNPGISSASISGSARINVATGESGGAFLHDASASGDAYGSNVGAFRPRTAGEFGGNSSATAYYVASPGSTFTVRAIWSGKKNIDFAVSINGVRHSSANSLRAVQLDGLTSLLLSSSHSMNHVVAASKFEAVALTKSESASLRWSFSEFWPGESQESPIEVPANHYDNGVTMPQNTTGGELTSFPVGEQGIGTDTPLYVASPYARATAAAGLAARQAAAALPEAPATSTDVQLRYQSDGPLFTHLLVPSSLGSGDSQFEIRIGANVLPVTAGTEVSLLGIAPTGVSELVLAGIDPGALGTEADPLDVLVGLRFASSGDTALSVTVIPEPSSLILASIGSFAVVMGLRSRRAARRN